MPRHLTASDRKSLIRLASSLPQGSSQRRAILAGLKKTSAEEWTGSDRDRVKVSLEPYRMPPIWEGEVTIAEAKKMDEHLGNLHQMAENRQLDRVLSIDEEIEALKREKAELEREFGKAIAWAKKMKIWPHFERGGNTMIPVAFEDADGDFHQIIDGEVE